MRSEGRGLVARARASGRATALLAVVASLAGCRGFTRAQAGFAFDPAGRPRRSGPVVALDAAIALPRSLARRPLPFAVHTSLDVVLAPERKAAGWGTGLVFYRPPRPIAPYALGGTSIHVDEVGGRTSFGNLSPYGEVGVLASVPGRREAEGRGLVLSLGVAGAMYLNYLASPRDFVDGFVVVKLGVGWEAH